MEPADRPGLSTWLTVPLTYGKGLIILALFFVLYHLAARAEWRWFVTTMSDQSEEVVTTEDLTTMRSLRSRRRARNRAARLWGKRAGHLHGQLQREQVNLATLLAREQRRGGDGAKMPPTWPRSSATSPRSAPRSPRSAPRPDRR
ncbi:hypothetical protein GCM10029992_40270 [Glycomyces albus]